MSDPLLHKSKIAGTLFLPGQLMKRLQPLSANDIHLPYDYYPAAPLLRAKVHLESVEDERMCFAVESGGDQREENADAGFKRLSNTPLSPSQCNTNTATHNSVPLFISLQSLSQYCFAVESVLGVEFSRLLWLEPLSFLRLTCPLTSPAFPALPACWTEFQTCSKIGKCQTQKCNY